MPSVRFKDLIPSTVVTGILPGASVTVVAAKWRCSEMVELTHKIATGLIANELLAREAELQISTPGLPWSFKEQARKISPRRQS